MNADKINTNLESRLTIHGFIEPPMNADLSAANAFMPS